jgi:hypothetical protein
MRYILLLILLLLLFFFCFYKLERFEVNEQPIETNYKCNDVSPTDDLRINNDGEILTLNEAVSKATEINRLSPGEAYEGIYKNGNDYYFCKDLSNTNDIGNTIFLKTTVDGSIVMKGNIGVKTQPLDSFILNNEGTLLVKDKLCLQKEDKDFICLTSDDIYRIKNRPITIPREKELCLSKFNEETGIEESACVDHTHFKLLSGDAVSNLKHMDYSQPKYGDGYVKYGFVKNHQPHIHYRAMPWYGMYKNYYKSYSDGKRGSNSFNLMQVGKNKNNSLFVGFDINKPWGRTERVGTQLLKTRR